MRNPWVNTNPWKTVEEYYICNNVSCEECQIKIPIDKVDKGKCCEKCGKQLIRELYQERDSLYRNPNSIVDQRHIRPDEDEDY